MSRNFSSPPPPPPPHVTLNSGQRNLLSSDPNQPIYEADNSSRPYSPNERPPAAPSYDIFQARPAQRQLYRQHTPAASSELLIPPTSRSRPYQDFTPSQSPTRSGYSSRRTSISSDGGERNPFASPFDDSRAPSRNGSDDDNVNTQTVAEKYNITPSAGLLLYPEDVEKDDYLHTPSPGDDKNRECDIWSKRGIVNVGGLLFVTLGILTLFIGYPVITFLQRVVSPNQQCAEDPNCINVGNIPLLTNIRHGLIDPDTPQSAMTKQNADGSTWNLVFSDEFNTEGRTFYDGDDPYFEAVDLWYGVTQDLEYYDPDAVTTKGGVMEITFEDFANHNLNYRSGMVQTWNKLCFKGGRMEASISLPGAGSVSGLWPGFWSMGNLGRPGYAATTDGMWPYSYDDVCDAGITANQSDPDGVNYLPGMRLPACTCNNQDHPTPGRSRSAPELDALEASVGYLGPGKTNQVGSVSQSAQIAPFDIFYAPDYDFVELYDPTITSMNGYRGGPYQQAMSGLSWMNNDWYDGKAYQTYSFAYTPGKSGNIVWYIGDEATWGLDARAIGPNGNIGQRTIPEEPMAMVINCGMSPSFAPIQVADLQALFPAKMRLDFVRIYQPPGSESLTCDPPGYETTDYIAKHPTAYQNINKTHWADAGYSWPQNTLVNGCS